MTRPSGGDTATRQGIPRSVWALGFVSLFMDISSEIIHGLLPVYLVAVLGASALTVGVIEGVAEATASITKVFSGVVSDFVGRRKWLVAFGYGLSALTKPIFPLAGSVGWFMAARFLDRIGKGIRGAPRDALVADVTPPHLLGAAFGLRQALDTVGAALGPLIALLLLTLAALEVRTVFWIAVIPAVIAVTIVLLGVDEPSPVAPRKATGARLGVADIRRLDPRYWSVVAVGTVLTLARFSEAFLLLRAQELGLRLALAPVVLILMNVVYSLSAYPLGRLADRVAPERLLIAGAAVLVASDLALGLLPSLAGAALGIALWGLHMGLTQGLLSMLVAATAPAELRGTAFGVFHLITGGALLLASVLAGALWVTLGSSATFLCGAALTLLAGAGFAVLLPLRRTASR